MGSHHYYYYSVYSWYIMKEFIAVFLLVSSSLVQGVEVKDEQRECPDGFFYAGEVPDVTRGEVWSKGETSPVYSCYSIVTESLDWVAANQKCFEQKGQLLSVNNNQEEAILTGELFMNYLKEAAQEVLTSGISLKEGNWTWFGAGETINEEITTELDDSESNSTDTQCLVISWTAEENGANLTYLARSCVEEYTKAVCEVRVYTQTWYVWATTNWLQILFLFTQVLLLVSSCVTVQIYTSRPANRSQRRSAEIPATPPPYSPQDITMTTNNKAPNKYKEKGKELLAKVVFYRQAEDKQKLTTNA